MLKLYSFQMSSASYRVRIVMALKGLDYQIIPINLNEKKHLEDEYAIINPQKRVPMLIDNDAKITQSIAIIEYLEEKFPNPSIFPIEIIQKAKCRAFANYITSDIFPLQNLSTRQKIASDFGADASVQKQWCNEIITKGFFALEQELQNRKSNENFEFLFADYPTLADVCLVPQMRNARRYGVNLSGFPLLVEYDNKLQKLDSFIETA